MAATVIWGSVIFAALIIAIFLLLVARRLLGERRMTRESKAMLAATKDLLLRIQNLARSAPSGQSSKAARMHAVLNLARLLRGSERVKLMELADEDGLFGSALRDLTSNKPRQRAQAVELLDQFESQKCVAALRTVMANDPVYELRLAAAFTLARFGRLPSPRETISQMSLLTNENSRIHLALFRALAPLYPAQLQALLRDPAYHIIKASIVDALGWSDDLTCLAEIERASLDADPEVRCAALRAAGQLGQPEAGNWIIARLADPNVNVRIQAIRCASRLSLSQAHAQIEALSNDPSAWVRCRADEALFALQPAKLKARI